MLGKYLFNWEIIGLDGFVFEFFEKCSDDENKMDMEDRVWKLLVKNVRNRKR